LVRPKRRETRRSRSGERRLYPQVADQIRDLIQSRRIAPGDRLPPERELAQTLGVSRPSLREALIALEIEGAIGIRMGSGLYVLAATTRPSRPIRIGDSPIEVMQARATIAGAVIVLAAARVTDDALRTLRHALDGMRTTIAAGSKPLDHDRLFHTTSAEQSGNAVLARIVGELFDERRSPMSAGFRDRFETPAASTLALGEHEAIRSVEAALARQRPTVIARTAEPGQFRTEVVFLVSAYH
jgi:GntR family transcriptional regulator, transcriptional repressor for pyruvate dehydrogenase complex